MAIPAEIIDSHHHLWAPQTSELDIGYVWLKDIGAPKPFGDPTPIQRDYLIEEFLAESAPTKIGASVHLQADGAIPDPVAETRFVEHQARTHGHKMVIVGFVDLSSDIAETTLEQHMQTGSFRGVRQILSRLEERPDISFARVEYLQDPVWRQRFSLLAERDLTFDLQCYPEQMHEAADFLADHTDVPVIVDHAGSPWDQSENGLKRWREGLASLASLSHVAIKMGGFGMFDTNWNDGSVRHMFETIEELFGPERMLFASNFPVDKLMRSYRDILADMEKLTAHWPQSQQDAFFSGNAKHIYRI